MIRSTSTRKKAVTLLFSILLSVSCVFLQSCGSRPAGNQEASAPGESQEGAPADESASAAPASPEEAQEGGSSDSGSPADGRASAAQSEAEPEKSESADTGSGDADKDGGIPSVSSPEASDEDLEDFSEFGQHRDGEQADLPEYSAAEVEDDLYSAPILDYIVEANKDMYEESDVSVPCFNMVKNDFTDPQDILVWGYFHLYNYNLYKTNLECVSGGTETGVMHMKTNDDGSYTVTSWERAFTDDEEKAICKKHGFDDSLFTLTDEDREYSRENTLKGYIDYHNLDIYTYQDYGWPKKIIHTNRVSAADLAGVIWYTSYALGMDAENGFSLSPGDIDESFLDMGLRICAAYQPWYIGAEESGEAGVKVFQEAALDLMAGTFAADEKAVDSTIASLYSEGEYAEINRGDWGEVSPRIDVNLAQIQFNPDGDALVTGVLGTSEYGGDYSLKKDFELRLKYSMTAPFGFTLESFTVS